MNKAAVIIAFLLCAVRVPGQQANIVAAPVPSQPFIAPVSEFFAWEITITPAASQPADAPDNGSNPVVKQTFTRTKHIRRIVSVRKDGSTEEKWIFQNSGFTPLPGGKVILSQEPKLSEVFSQFRWISAGNFKGVIENPPDRLLYFEETKSWDETFRPGVKVDPSEYEGEGIERPKDVTRKAYINERTRMPVAFVENDVVYRFTILPPPTAVLTLPGSIAQAAATLSGR